MYNLNIAKMYVGDWELWEALRELIQNWVDQKEATGDKEDAIRWDPESRTLSMINHDVSLSMDSFVLGSTNKGGTDARGHFGEGMKLAWLVLTRLSEDRQDLQLSVSNGREVWIPQIFTAEGMTVETLHVEVVETQSESVDQVFSVCVSGLAIEEWEHVLARCLFLGEYQKETLPPGEILIEERHAGKVFNRGIYVCDTPERSDYGYNFNDLDTSRDRSFSNPYLIRCKVHEMIEWLAYESQKGDRISNEFISNLFASIGEEGTLESGSSRDYAGYSSSANRKDLSEVMARHFRAEYGQDSFPVAQGKHEDADIVRQAGLNPVYVSAGLIGTLQNVYSIKRLTDSPEPIEECPVDALPSDQRDTYDWLVDMAGRERIGRIVRFKGVQVKQVQRPDKSFDISQKILENRRDALSILSAPELVDIILKMTGKKSSPNARTERDRLGAPHDGDATGHGRDAVRPDGDGHLRNGAHPGDQGDLTDDGRAELPRGGPLLQECFPVHPQARVEGPFAAPAAEPDGDPLADALVSVSTRGFVEPDERPEGALKVSGAVEL